MKTSKGSSLKMAYQNEQRQSENENKYLQQLEDIYQFCSKSFKLQINSPEILFETINALIKDMKTLKKENDKMKVNAILNSQDIFSSSNSEIEENNNENEKSKAKSEKIKIARYKKQMSQMQQLIIDQQTKISDYDTKLQEVSLNIKDLEIQNKRYEQEISRLMKENRINKRDVSIESNDNKGEDGKDENNMVESVVKLFDDLIQNQSEEIISLSDQRNKLSGILHKSDQVLIQMESEYQALQSQNEATITTLRNSQIQSSQADSIFPSIIEEIHELGVSYPLISKSESNHDFIIETITNILKDDKEQSKEKDDNNKVAREQYEIVLEQLESSMKFIQNIANASPILDKSSIQQPLYIDSISRTILLTQCARIGQFIDRNSLFAYSTNENPRISIFDPRLLQDPEQFLKPLLENASEELMTQSPTRELYALFIGISEVNKMLLNYIEHFENKDAYEKDIELSEREIEDIKSWKAEQENKIRMIAHETGMLNIPLEDVLDNFLNVYLDTVQENSELQKELQNDRENVDKNDLVETDAAEIKKQLDDVESRVLREKEKHKKEISQLKKELAKYKEKCNQLAESLQKSTEFNENKERKYKKTKQAFSNLKRLVDEVEEKVQNVSEDNEQLNNTIESLNETIKQQNSEIAKAAEKIQKLHEQKNNLSERLRESEEKNETTLTGIKNRSEMLNEKYSSTIRNLENEVQNARQEAKNAEDEKAKLLIQKNDLSNQLVKLRVTEKSLRIKLDTLENRNSLNQKENEQVKSALVRSIKAEASMKIEKSRDEYEKLKNAIIRILREKFNVTFNKSTSLTTPLKSKKKREIVSSGSNNTINSYFNSDNNSNSGSLQNEDLFDDSNTVSSTTDFVDNSPSVDDIIQKVENCLQASSDYQTKLNELKEARAILNIPETESLSKGAKAINDSLKELMKQNAELRTNSDNVRLRCAEVDRKRNEQEKAIKAAAEWDQWSKSILYRITEGTSAIRSTRDVRFLLEEALLSTIGRRGILTKLDILKAEKKIFTTFAASGNLDILNLNAIQGPDAPPQPLLIIKIGSIRPMMVAIMFIRRIQVMSHRLPVKLAPFQKREEFESTSMSDQ